MNAVASDARKARRLAESFLSEQGSNRLCALIEFEKAAHSLHDWDGVSLEVLRRTYAILELSDTEIREAASALYRSMHPDKE